MWPRCCLFPSENIFPASILTNCIPIQPTCCINVVFLTAHYKACFLVVWHLRSIRKGDVRNFIFCKTFPAVVEMCTGLLNSGKHCVVFNFFVWCNGNTICQRIWSYLWEDCERWFPTSFSLIARLCTITSFCTFVFIQWKFTLRCHMFSLSLLLKICKWLCLHSFMSSHQNMASPPPSQPHTTIKKMTQSFYLSWKDRFISHWDGKGGGAVDGGG